MTTMLLLISLFTGLPMVEGMQAMKRCPKCCCTDSCGKKQCYQKDVFENQECPSCPSTCPNGGPNVCTNR